MNYNLLHLHYDTLDYWPNSRGPYRQCLSHFGGYDVPELMVLEQTHVNKHILVFLSTIFCSNLFANKVYVDF